mmetsp:Transcript_5262/g.10821  ORF Transcript_5262/g.10821 Transcript_5262/m.10821 type:complete len:317 (+) Transcript_5262:336-1286(+)
MQLIRHMRTPIPRPAAQVHDKHDCGGQVLHRRHGQRFHFISFIVRSYQQTGRIHNLAELRKGVLAQHHILGRPTGFAIQLRNDSSGDSVIVGPEDFDVTQCHATRRKGIIVDFRCTRGNVPDNGGFANIGTSHQDDGGSIERHGGRRPQSPLQIDQARDGFAGVFLKQLQYGVNCLFHKFARFPRRFGRFNFGNPINAHLSHHFARFVNVVQHRVECQAILFLSGAHRQVGHDAFKGVQAFPLGLVSLDRVTERHAQGVYERVDGFGAVFAGSISDIFNVGVGFDPAGLLGCLIEELFGWFDHRQSSESSNVAGLT